MHYNNRQEGIKKAKKVIRANPNWRSSFSILIKTRKPCSCVGGCGHYRDAYGKTIQERKADLETEQQIKLEAAER